MSEKEVTIELIQDNWATDSIFDKTKLDQISLSQLNLHQKYFKILNFAKRKYQKILAEQSRLKSLKSDYYSNTMAPEELKRLGWKPNKRLVVKADMERAFEYDEDLIELNLRIGEVISMIEYLESIIKSISQMSFIIKNTIEYDKFLNGIS